MIEHIQIRNWRQMWNDYVYEGQKQGLKNGEIRRNLIEAFRKEIFDQIMFRAKVEDLEQLDHTEENDRIVHSIFREAMKKWKALVKECRGHLATAMLIREEDLTLFDREEEPEEDEDDGYEIGEAEDPEEEEEVDEMTAEWPELSEEPEKELPLMGADFDWLDELGVPHWTR